MSQNLIIKELNSTMGLKVKSGPSLVEVNVSFLIAESILRIRFVL